MIKYRNTTWLMMINNNNRKIIDKECNKDGEMVCVSTMYYTKHQTQPAHCRQQMMREQMREVMMVNEEV
jgi:hypothetical protein